MKKLYTFLVFAFFLCEASTHAQICTSKASANWEPATTWSYDDNSCGGLFQGACPVDTYQPTSTISATIDGENITVPVSTSSACLNLIISSGSLLIDGDLRVHGTANITGDITINGSLTIDGNTTIGGNLTLNGSLIINGNLTTSNTKNLSGSGTLTVSGNTTIGGNRTIINTPTINLNGALSVTGTFNTGASNLITVGTNFTNNGAFTLGANSTLDATGYFLNSTSGVAHIYGSIIADSYGDNQNDVFVYSGASVSLGTTFYNATFGVFDLQANTSFTCTGTFTNDGSFLTSGSLDVTGAAINTDALSLRAGADALFKNNFTNEVFAALTITSADFETLGNLTNDEEITIANNGTFKVVGNVVNGDDFADFLQMTGPVGTVHIGGTLTNNCDFTAYDSLYIGGTVSNNESMFIYATQGFYTGGFTTNNQLELYNGAKGTINGNFVNTNIARMANACELTITGNFSQSNADVLTMTGPTGSLSIGGTLTNTGGDVTLYDTFETGTFTNSSTGDVYFEGSLNATFTGNMENSGYLYFNGSTTGGNLTFNMGANTFRTINPAIDHTTATYIDCNSITVNGNFYSNNSITIAAGKTFTVTGTFELDDPSGTTTVPNIFTLNGTGNFGTVKLTNNNLDTDGNPTDYLTEFYINNNFTSTSGITFNNSSYFSNSTTYGKSGALVRINAGTIDLQNDIHFNTGNITGDMTVDNGTFYDADVDNVFNAIEIASASPITIDGQIEFGAADAPNIVTRGGNFILINSNAVNITFTHGEPFLNYQGGMRTDNTYIFGDNESGGNLIFNTDSTHLVLPTHPNNSFPDVFVEGSCDTVVTQYQTYQNQIKGTLYIGHDGVDRVIKLVDNANFDGFEGSSYGNFKIGITEGGAPTAANCVYLMKDAACENGIPEFGSIFASRFEFNNNTIFEYFVSAGNSYEVLGESTRGTYLQYPRVYLTGPGEKVYTADNGAFLVLADNNLDYVELFDGTLTFEAGCDFFLTNDYSYGGKFITYDGSTINIEGNFNNAPRANVFLGLNSNERHTTVNYNGTADQTLYQFYEDGFDNYGNPQIIEEYDILEISNSSAIVRTGSDILVGTRIDLGDNITLELDGDIRLLSNATYTAFVSEINDASTVTLDYSGGGNFIIEKYQNYTGYSAPDLSSPILGQTLENLNNHIEMRGFPGSNKPGNKFSSVSWYTEAVDGNVNQGFEKPGDITDPIFGTNGMGQITRSAYRINIDPSTFTLEDEGQIRTGTQTYELTFNNNTGSRIADDGYNVIGNPYAAPIDLKAIYDDADNSAITALTPSFYTYQYFDNGGLAGYGAYQAVTGFTFGGASQILPSHAAVWLKTYEAVSSSETYLLQVKESHKANLETSNNLKAKDQKAKPIAAEIKLSTTGVVNDQIYFHFWPKAEANVIDKLYDLPRIGQASNRSNSINFSNDYKENLNLLANAFDSKLASVKLPLLLNITKAGSFTLELNNLESFLAVYSCASLVDLETGERYELENNNAFTFNTNLAFNNTRFVVELRKDLSEFITINQPKCSYDMGGLQFTAKTGTPEQLTVRATNGFNSSLATNGTSYNFNKLEDGVYTITNYNGLIGCTSNEYVFSIKTPEQMLKGFSVSDSLISIEQAVTFTADAAAVNYLWEIEDKTYTTSEVQHTFENSGTQRVLLSVGNEDMSCIESVKKHYDVQGLKTAITETENDVNNVYYANNKINITNPDLYTDISVFDLSGKLIASKNTLNSKVLPSGAYIIKLTTTQGEVKSVKFVSR